MECCYGINIMTTRSFTPRPEVSEYQFSESISYLISRVNSVFGNMTMQRTMAELGITNTQGSILFMVMNGKCRLAAELAREYGIDASAVTRLIDRLEKRGLLTRVRGSEDKRVARLDLTPRGLVIAAQIPGIFTDICDNLLSGFTPEEAEFLRRVLRRVLVSTGDLANIGL